MRKGEGVFSIKNNRKAYREMETRLGFCAYNQYHYYIQFTC